MTRSQEVQLLKKAIADSGLSINKYATDVLLRNERTLRRWLAGDSPVSPVVVQFLKRNAARAI